jgi:hypothetical protein
MDPPESRAAKDHGGDMDVARTIDWQNFFRASEALTQVSIQNEDSLPLGLRRVLINFRESWNRVAPASVKSAWVAERKTNEPRTAAEVAREQIGLPPEIAGPRLIHEPS